MFYLDGNCFSTPGNLKSYLERVYPFYNKREFNSVVRSIQLGFISKDLVESELRRVLNLKKVELTNLPLQGYIYYNCKIYNSYIEFKEFLRKYDIPDSMGLKIWNDVVPLGENLQPLKLKRWLVNMGKDIEHEKENISSDFKERLSNYIRDNKNNSFDKNTCILYKNSICTFKKLYRSLGGTNLESVNYSFFENSVKKAYKVYGDTEELWCFIESLQSKVLFDEHLLYVPGLQISTIEELQLFLSEVYYLDISDRQIMTWLTKVLHLNYSDRYQSFENILKVWLKKSNLSSEKDIYIDDCVFHSYKDVICYMCDLYNIPISKSKIDGIRSYMRKNNFYELEPEFFSRAMHTYFKKLKDRGGI